MANVNVKRIHVVTHSNEASFSIKTFFYKTNNFIYLKYWRYLLKIVKNVFERSVKIKVRSPWTFLVILFPSAVICKQSLLYGNKTVQHCQNYKCYGVEQDHFRKHSYSCAKFFEKNDLKTNRIIFKGHSVIGYF